MMLAHFYRNTNFYFADRLHVTSLAVAFFSSLSPVVSVATTSAFKTEVLNKEILLWRIFTYVTFKNQYSGAKTPSSLLS